MAYLTLDKKKLKHNYTYLEQLFSSHGIEWAVVTKLLCGHKDFLKEVLNLGIRQICDSRITNLKNIKLMDSSIETIYIKPPARVNAGLVVNYADISVNTETKTIERLSLAAVKQKKVHKVIIMVELGELREGVMGKHLMEFYERVFNLPNIDVIGVGANLSCLYGVLPSQDKLIRLILYKQLIDTKFSKNLNYISGGSSVTIPLLKNGELPEAINHFRVGETLFFGTNVYDGTRLPGMEYDVFKLYVNILEIKEKPMVPCGEFGTNLEGESYAPDRTLIGQSSLRALIDIGLLDVDKEQINFEDQTIKILGATSDMIVVDLKDNPQGYKVGDQIPIQVNYMSALKLLNSKYIGKRIV